VWTCPSWSWSSGDEAKIKSYLPKEKQFLVTRNVPCLRRCKEMENYSGIEKLVEEESDGDGWVTHETGDNEDENECAAEMTLETMNLNDDIDRKEFNGDDDDEGEEALDMEDFEESGQLETVDPSVAIIAQKSNAITECDTGDSIVHTRTYDLYITYNKCKI
jgi:ubiquitin-like-conjugating enzyme ATG3